MAKITWHFLANPAQQRFVNWNEWRPSFESAMRLKRMQVVILVRHPMHLGRRTSASMWRFGVWTSICIFSFYKFQRLISIAEPPPTPQNLSILDIQSRSVKVAWSVELASPAIDRLVVQWKEQTGMIMMNFFCAARITELINDSG